MSLLTGLSLLFVLAVSSVHREKDRTSTLLQSRRSTSLRKFRTRSITVSTVLPPSSETSTPATSSQMPSVYTSESPGSPIDPPSPPHPLVHSDTLNVLLPYSPPLQLPVCPSEPEDSSLPLVPLYLVLLDQKTSCHPEKIKNRGHESSYHTKIDR